VGYEWPGWAMDALRGIEPHEVVQALGSMRRWPRRAVAPSGLAVLTVWARTAGGRPLIVAVQRIDDWDWLILGARDMRLPERAEFARWEGSRND
jgi:hypothetical protein